MRIFTELVPVEEALRIALQAAEPLHRTESVPLHESVGRVLAADVVSPVDVPAFDKAMMDGFALRSRDVVGGEAVLRVVGRSHPGEPFAGSVGAGECVQVATGAAVPAGCDTVLEVERAEVQREEVRVTGSLRPGRNVSPRGDDLRAGAVLLHRGLRLRAGHLGAIAAVGSYEVTTFARPRVAIFATGREIKRGGPLAPGEIYDVNTFTLGALVREHGGEPRLHDPVPDTYEAIRGAVARGREFDLSVLSGSTSVGERDYLREAADELGEVLFHGVAVKPGKPLLLARVSETPLFGMPGFPASCLMTAYHFLLPVLWRTAHLPPLLSRAAVVLGEDLPWDPKRTLLVSLRLENGLAYPAFRGSGNITSVSGGEGYAAVPPGEQKKEGERVEVILF